MDKSSIVLLAGILIIAAISVFSLHEWEPSVTGKIVSPTLVNIYSTLALFVIIGISLYFLSRK